jgi:hypothetical protein
MKSSLDIKLAHLPEPGQVVNNVDGRLFRVMSKSASADGIRFKLADLQGNAVPTPENFTPLSPAMAHFAGWMKRVLAFNSDYDMYVKEYIRAAGLPVDEKMNWARWFQKKFVPYLHTQDAEVQDEAVHYIIVYAFQDIKILDAHNKTGFKYAIKNFPIEVQKLPKQEQVSKFLQKWFLFKTGTANRFIKTVIFQEDADSMVQPEMGSDGEEAERNILDTEEHATGTHQFEMAEANADVMHFRKEFAKWLLAGHGKKTAENYVILFDIYWHHIAHNDLVDTPKIGDMLDSWHERTGLSRDSLKVFYSRLPKLIEEFIAHHKHEMGDSNIFVRVIEEIQRSREEHVEPSAAPAPKQKAQRAKASFEEEEKEELPLSGANVMVTSADDRMPCCGSITGYHKSDCPKYNENLTKTLDTLMALPKRATPFASPVLDCPQREDMKCHSCNQCIGEHDEGEVCTFCGDFLCGTCRMEHTCEKLRAASAKSAAENAVTELSIPDAIKAVITGGLFESDPEPHFSWHGCQHCANGLGNSVYNCRGYLNLEDAQSDSNKDNQLEFELCGDCLNNLYYGHGVKTSADQQVAQVPQQQNPQGQPGQQAVAPQTHMTPPPTSGFNNKSVTPPPAPTSPKRTIPPELPNAIMHMPPMPPQAMMGSKKAHMKSTDPHMQHEVEVLLEHGSKAKDHESVVPVYEHGQWWVTCNACGALWSVVDVAGAQGLDLEQIDNGDDSCFEMGQFSVGDMEPVMASYTEPNEICTNCKEVYGTHQQELCPDVNGQNRGTVWKSSGTFTREI